MSIGEASSAASLSEAHRSQLAHIVDTDVIPDELDWLTLRQAITQHIRTLLTSSTLWPESQVELHKAASVLPPPPSDAPVTLADRFVPATSTPADVSSVSTEDSIQLDAVQQQKQHEEMAAAAWVVKPGEEQHFYPSKRRAPTEPPWNGSWGRTSTGEALEEEISEIQRGLAAFEAPPFTMQRLAELVLAPFDSARTPGKFLSALRRCLAVTATHASFTGLPLDDDVVPPPTNGFVSTTGSTTGYDVTVPSTAPLFSPIPFLTARADELPEEEVPGMELGGADRTTEQASMEAGMSGAGRAGAAPGTPGALAEAPCVSPTTDEPSQGAAQPMPVVATTASSISHGATAPLIPVEPLGVPAGKIDEVDELPHRVVGARASATDARRIASLGTTPSVAVVASGTAETVSSSNDASTAPDGGRATKRAKPASDDDTPMTHKMEEATPTVAPASAPHTATSQQGSVQVDQRAQVAHTPETQD